MRIDEIDGAVKLKYPTGNFSYNDLINVILE